MNQQPDTKTKQGRIAVMQAELDGKRIQCACDSRDSWEMVVNPSWNWLALNYRIHPDDLNPPRKPREVWIAEYPGTLGCIATFSEATCRACANPDAIGVVKFREVIE